MLFPFPLLWASSQSCDSSTSYCEQSLTKFVNCRKAKRDETEKFTSPFSSFLLNFLSAMQSGRGCPGWSANPLQPPQTVPAYAHTQTHFAFSMYGINLTHYSTIFLASLLQLDHGMNNVRRCVYPRNRAVRRVHPSPPPESQCVWS